jgi:hypothetical protein
MESDSVVPQINPYTDPIIRWKIIKCGLAKDLFPDIIQPTKIEVNSSPIIQKLLGDRDSNGQIPFHPYNKWFGAHWVLSNLADLGYPEDDDSLKPLLEQSYDWLLSKEHAKYIQTINGRVRRCASQEGNCVYYSIALGLADERTEELAARLIKWQWEDGGWNCDKRPEAIKSSFFESLIPLRGLAWYASESGDSKAKHAVARAVDVFLRRSIFKRLSNHQIMDINFVQLHYPCYWHYDILFGLKVLSEAGFLNDPRCSGALDLLESKRLVDGGYPAESKYYRVDNNKLSGHSHVDWGGTSKMHMNPFVTLDALTVLKQSGRLV